MTWNGYIPGTRQTMPHGPRDEPADMVAVERAIDQPGSVWLTANELRLAVLVCRRRGYSVRGTARLLGCSSRHVARLRSDGRAA